MNDLLTLLFVSGFNYQMTDSIGWMYYRGTARCATFYKSGVLPYDSITGRELFTDNESNAVQYVLDHWEGR